MDFDVSEEYFYCPHCDEKISVIIDLSVESQEYIEDCEVCCRPIKIKYSNNVDNLTELSVSNSI